MSPVRVDWYEMCQFVVYVLALVVIVTQVNAANKEFTVTWYDGRITNFTFTKTDSSECVYDSKSDVLKCMRNYKFENVTRIWKYKPEVIKYISVTCLKQEYYSSHQHVCLCKNGSSSAHPSRQLQYDQHYFCYINSLTRELLSPLSKVEAVDLSSNVIRNVHGNAFDECRTLKYLNLGNNLFTHLPAALFCDNHDLEIIVLRDHKLTSFPLHMFDCSRRPSNVTLLDLSNGDIAHIESHSLKYLSKLKSLNLSGNSLENIISNAFSNGSSMQHLDLSYNRLTNLPEKICTTLSKLQYLVLSGNKLSTLNWHDLNDCGSLVHLELNSNRLQSLTGGLLFTSLRKLNLSSNMLLEFPVSTLINASGLLELDLSKNNISTFTNQHLKNLVNLQFLSLSWNRLTFEGRNESSIFTSLPKLSSLDLSHNNIHKLFNGMFMNNSLITTLDMSFNNISEVESESFRGLVALETLHLNHNNIRTLPSTVFELLSNLKELDISYNNLVNFDNMKISASLSFINLNTNNIQEFPNSFNGSYVSEVDLSGNSIPSLPLLRLKGINNIKGLNLARNALKTIEENAFKDASSLQNLNLEKNELNLIFSRGIFKGADSLSHLNLADNKISTVDNIFDIESLRNLKVLDMKKNDIVQIKSLSSNVTSDIKIESILLSECKIKYIADAFRGLKKLKLADLHSNDIQTFPPFLSNPNAVYNLTENPIICACNMSWLSKDYIYVNGIQISTHAYKVKYCSVYPNNWTIEVKQVQKDEYLCPKEDCCDKTACCSCFSRDTTAIEVAVCKSGLQIYPWNATRNSRVVYLDGHNFLDLFGSNSSSQMANEELYLNSSFISAIHASFMMGFTKLKILDLHNNQIQTLPSMLFKHQGVLQYLYLSHNHISVIQKDAFEGLNSLLFLDLSYNKFHYVNPDSFSTFSSSLRYKLSYNPLECDCKNKDFKQWIQRYRGRIIDRYDIVCVETGKHILYADLKTCDVKDSGESSLTRTNVIILVVILAVVIAVISTVCFYYRRDLVAILYDVTGVGCFRQKNYGNKLNDIYLSYDSNDSRCSEWVDTQLLPRLKTRKNGYRIIVPDRTDLHDSVTNAGSDAILSCKCCIILVSKNMHTNDVCLEEFRKAYNFSLTNPLYKVILVIFGTVDILSLEPEMRQMMSKGDYITARSRTVWSRIRYELPNPNTSHFNDDDVSENDVVLYSATDNYQYVTLR